ncbi:MAG: hydroxymethylbilane synthase [Planctomycetia bacterium]|jgi:hydroxymethylbilane synthase
MKLRLGTRGSKLARWQADWVASQLTKLGAEVELVPISTTGDQNQTGPIENLSGQGVFTKEIQRALVENRIDLAVHSLKDLSTQPVSGLILAAVPPRGPIEDALIACDGRTLAELPAGAVVGTGSLRRRTQLLHARPDLKTTDIRGNVDTRLAKLDAGDYDAIILAVAGLERLGLADRITEVLSKDTMHPAVGQGALGIETREDDDATRSLVEQLDDPATHASIHAERTLLKTLEGGCLAPIAAWTYAEVAELFLAARVTSVDGKERLDAELSMGFDATDPASIFQVAETLGLSVAANLRTQGADRLIAASRNP